MCKTGRRGGWPATALLSAIGLLAGPDAAWAWATYDQFIDWGTKTTLTGSRSTTGGVGLVGFNQYSKDQSGNSTPALSVRWDIKKTGNDTYHYKYTFSGDAFRYFGVDGSGVDVFHSKTKSQQKYNAIDHIVVDVGSDCQTGGSLNACVTNSVVKQSLSVSSVTGIYGNFDGIEGGARFDSPTGTGYHGVIYEFDSDRAPVWGHLAVSGNADFGCNNPGSQYGVACSGALLAFLDNSQDWGNLTSKYFVAVPDNHDNNIPEPATITLLVAGLAAFAWSKRGNGGRRAG